MRSLALRFATILTAALLAITPSFAAPAKTAATPAKSAKAARAAQRYTIEQFLSTTALLGSSFSPDKSKILVSSDQTGVFNAFAIPAGGGKPLQLTRSTTDAIFVESYFPSDERFVYSSDQGGNELNHLYVRELDERVVDLTPGEKLKANFLDWAYDDRSFFISTNERDSRFFDIYEVTVDGYKRSLIYQDSTGYDLADISSDKRYLVFQKNSTQTNSDVYLYDRQAREMKRITPHEGAVTNEAQSFSPDAKVLYYLSNEGGEFEYVVRYELATGDRKVVEKPGWDVMYAYPSKHGKYLVVGINNDARTEIRVYEAATMKLVELPKLPDADITAVKISDDESRMCFYVSGSRSPRDLYVLDFASGKAEALTRSLSPAIDPADLVEARVVRFKSSDGVEVPGLIYKPHQASAKGKAPALLYVHGGPGDQSRIGYNALIQYLVNHGYVLYAINNRGSSGYGRSFLQMDDHKHGEGDLDDCVASKKMLIETGYVDPQRIGILGGSYGGYMVLAAMAYRPKEFVVGVDLFGVANWVRTLKSIPPWWESYRNALYQEMGNPETEEDYLRKISPLFHAGDISRPMIVLQGANDPRVLKVESDEMVEAARKNGAKVDYVVFDDEGHGFVKKENRIRGYKAILEFLDKNLAEAKAG